MEKCKMNTMELNTVTMNDLKMHKRAGVTFLEITLLMVSIFAFGWILGSEFVLVNAEKKLLEGGGTVDVTLQNDGTFLDTKTGKIYHLESGGLVEGRLVPKTVSATSAGPADFPTRISPVSRPLLGGGTGASAAAGGLGGIGSASALAAPMGQLGSILTGPLGQALIWGGVVFGGAFAVASVFGGDSDLVEAVAIAAGIGTFTAKIASGYFNTGLFTSVLIGAGVGLAIFLLLYEDTKYESVTFSCLPWQAPVGVSKDVCETCNEEERPCSEYRCKSLGQTCEIVNAGEVDERCVNVNPKDVSPPIISPNDDELTVGYKYSNIKLSPPGPGFDIVRMDSANECVKAFTPLRFGITVNEPAQCKIDFKSTTSFDSMYSFMGGSNSFKYIHYEQFVLPHAEDFGNTSYQLVNGKDLTFFVRCQDKNGNTNEAEYAVNFCIDSSPDTTAPQIMLTSLENEACIAATTDDATVEFYTNEPAQCRWSRIDETYDLMENDMNCASRIFEINALQLYTCSAELTGVARDLTDFYVRCQDQQRKPVNDRNTNQESFRFSLRGSNQLKLRNLEPNSTIDGGINPMPVELTVETLFGCEKGKANCYFSSNGVDGDYVLFANTNTEDGLHSQTLYLPEGDHDYSVKCVDAGGNLLVDSTEFTVDIDTSSPIIARIYNDNDQLKIVTLRESECSYSYENCDYLFDEGIPMPKDNSEVHFAEWNNQKTYFIKCRDKYRDLTADCSAIVKPTKLFYE